MSQRRFLRYVCASAGLGLSAANKESVGFCTSDGKKDPKKCEFVIVGGGTAGFSAFKMLKDASDRSNIGNVLLLTNENHLPYMRPPLSKQLWDGHQTNGSGTFTDYDGKKHSIFYKDLNFYDESLDTAIYKGSEVSSIDPSSNSIHLASGECIRYDKCLLAPGGSPKSLDLFLSHDDAIRDRQSVFRSFDDFLKLQDTVKNCRKVAVVGGGYLGCELSIALANLDKSNPLEVVQIIPESGYMGLVLPPFLCRWVSRKVKAMGVNLQENARISSVNSSDDGNQLELTLNNGDKLAADHVIVAVGIEPNTSLASEANLEIDPDLGGIFVNGELQSSMPDIWVAGDACSFYDTRMNCRRRVEHHDHAVVSGRLAAKNMLASQALEKDLNVPVTTAEAFYHQSMFWGDLGADIGYEAIGIVDSKLPVKAYFKTVDGTVCVKSDSDLASSDDLDFSQGVLFYLEPSSEVSRKSNRKRVVGVVCWNIFGKIPNARGIIGQEFLDSETDKLSTNFL